MIKTVIVNIAAKVGKTNASPIAAPLSTIESPVAASMVIRTFSDCFTGCDSFVQSKSGFLRLRFSPKLPESNTKLVAAIHSKIIVKTSSLVIIPAVTIKSIAKGAETRVCNVSFAAKTRKVFTGKDLIIQSDLPSKEIEAALTQLLPDIIAAAKNSKGAIKVL